MAVNLATYRPESLDTWGEMAPGWEARREWLMEQTAPVLDWLVERADPRPGATLLDLAAGTGDLGFRLAERVGESGRVIDAHGRPRRGA